MDLGNPNGAIVEYTLKCILGNTSFTILLIKVFFSLCFILFLMEFLVTFISNVIFLKSFTRNSGHGLGVTNTTSISFGKKIFLVPVFFS